MSNVITKKNILDVAAVASYINVSQTKIYRLVNANQIPHFRIDTKILFDKSDVDIWIKSKKVSVN